MVQTKPRSGTAQTSPRHALVDVGSEPVERDGDAHPAVGVVAVVVAEQHDLVVVEEPVVRDGHVVGPDRHVHQPVLAPRQRVVVDPHLAARHHPDGVAVRAAAAATATASRPHGAAGPDRRALRLRADVVDVQPVDDDAAHLVQHDARAAGDVHVGAAPVDGREAPHEQRLGQPDVHAPLEGDPDLPAQHRRAVPQRARPRAHRVVAGVGHRVRGDPGPAVLPHLPGEAHRARGEPLPVGRPVGLPAPAPVDDVCGMDRGRCANVEDDNKEGAEEEFFGGHARGDLSQVPRRRDLAILKTAAVSICHRGVCVTCSFQLPNACNSVRLCLFEINS
jgi:hypothetical protein